MTFTWSQYILAKSLHSKLARVLQCGIDSIISLFITALISLNGRGEGEREHLVNFWVRMHKKVRPGLKLYLV